MFCIVDMNKWFVAGLTLLDSCDIFYRHVSCPLAFCSHDKHGDLSVVRLWLRLISHER